LQEGTQRRLPSLALVLPLLLVAVLAGAASGAVVTLLLDSGDSGAPAAPTASSTTTVPAANGEQVAAVVERVLPSVVTIINEQPEHQDDQGQTVQGVAVGSGFIIDDRGYIVTNEHVIHDTGKLTVVLSNGEERQAALVSQDAPFTDLAVVRIPGGGLQAVSFGDSDRLRLGQQVIAIGTALFEYRNSVTVGVVGGLQRRWLREGVYMEDLIQTDAAVNSGNSGGPLVTLDGKVVGVNSTVVRSIGSIDTVTGVAFAISSRTMQPIVSSIIQNGEYPRPYFGIDHQNIDDDLRATGTLGVDQGALVKSVTPGSPADAAGIKAGDVLLRIGRIDITDDTPFINALGEQAVDQPVDVRVWRGGNVFSTTVDLQPR
jgi:2-alkenal reductase